MQNEAARKPPEGNSMVVRLATGKSEEEKAVATRLGGWVHCRLASREKQLVKIKARGPLNGSEGKGVCHKTNLSSIPGANGGRENDP